LHLTSQRVPRRHPLSFSKQAKRTATHGNALQRAATHYTMPATHYTMPHTATRCNIPTWPTVEWLPHVKYAATHCHTLAKHCNTLQHAATHLQNTATRCNTLKLANRRIMSARTQYAATHCNRQHAAADWVTPQQTATHQLGQPPNHKRAQLTATTTTAIGTTATGCNTPKLANRRIMSVLLVMGGS